MNKDTAIDWALWDKKYNENPIEIETALTNQLLAGECHILWLEWFAGGMVLGDFLVHLA